MPKLLHISAARLTLVFVAALCVEGVDVRRSGHAIRSHGASRLVRSEPPPPVKTGDHKEHHKDTALSVSAEGEVALATGLRVTSPGQSGDATAPGRPPKAPGRPEHVRPAGPAHSAHEGAVRVEHEMAGCFPRAASDADDEEQFQDLTCDNISRYSADAPCRSGLPFFRLPMQKEQSYLDCFTFCLSKGLDLSGLLQSNRTGHLECRCGATTANVAAWHGRTPAPQLLLPMHNMVAENDTRCKVVVWRYTGLMQNGAVPMPLMQLSVSDETYVDSIAEHVDPKRIIEEDDLEMFRTPKVKVNLSHPNASTASLLSTKMICDDLPPAQNAVGQPCSNLGAFCNGDEFENRVIRSNCQLTCGACSQRYGPVPCYPNACGPGGGPWLSKKSDGNLYINFFYESNIDANRRAVFEAAMEEWESKVCVKFVPSASVPRIRVAIVRPDTCSAGVGFPGASGTVDVNLGWCNQLNHLGSVIHELGHALGMNHEQNRADGAQQAYVTGGYSGPYLNVKWQNIEAIWRPQWEGNIRSYDGSQTAGYSTYDYESIMHYGLGDQATAVNPAFQNVPGQRSSLSRADVAQFADMYQCPTPAPTPGPAPAGCQDSDFPFGNTCAGWRSVGACETSNGIREHCKVTCGTFGCGASATPAPPTQPVRTPVASPGCSDQVDSRNLVPGTDYGCAQARIWGYCTDGSSIGTFYCMVTCGTCPRR